MTKKTKHIHKARPSLAKKLNTGLRLVTTDMCRCGATRLTTIDPVYSKRVGEWKWENE